MNFDIKVLLKNQVLLVYSLLVGVFIIIGGWYLYEKVFMAIDALMVVESKEEELKLLTERVLKLESVDVDLYSNRNTEMLSKVLPDKVDLSLTLGAMVTMVRDANFEVKKGRIADGGDTEGDSLQRRRLEIEFIGEDANLRTILDRISKVTPLVEGDSIQVVMEDPESGNFKFSVVAYGWTPLLTQSVDDVFNLPALDNQYKYEELFSKIESWEEILPSMDFIFECDEFGDPFRFGGCETDITGSYIVNPSEVVVDLEAVRENDENEDNINVRNEEGEIN